VPQQNKMETKKEAQIKKVDQKKDHSNQVANQEDHLNI